ncbi:MAG TPA: hypothetical protein VK824_09580 [Planctomycetota bacterium]|nr:hypothetical protein [Planctomycetota bacterium]
MSGFRSIVFTTGLAVAVGVGVVAVVAHYVEPDGSMFGDVGDAASAATGASARADGSARAPSAQGFVVKHASVPLADGVTLEAFIALGPGAAPAAGGAEQRQLVATFDYRLRGFSLQSTQLYGSVAAADNGRRGAALEFDLNLAGRTAALLLGSSPEAAAPYAAVRKSPFYGANLDPRAGLTWGQVATDADLVLTVTQEP